MPALLAQSARTVSRKTSARRGFSPLGLIALMALIGGIVAAALWVANPAFLSHAEQQQYLVDKVKTGVFTHDVVERGEIESSSNVEVRSQVQSRTTGAGGGLAIIEIVPEGTMVAEGDFLIRLDDSALREELTQQQTVVNAAEATKIQSVATLETAKIAKLEYEQGTFKQDEELLRSEAFVAEENLRRAQEYSRHSERLAARGYVTQVQLEADKFAVKKAEADLALANTKLMVLRNFTKKKMVEQLDADIKIAQAKLSADERILAIENSKLEFIQSQIDKCTIRAPSGGQVVYANESGGRNGNDIVIQEGTVVRERQVIVRLPDPTQMQVKARINESRIDYVRPGLPVVIRLDALPGTELHGTVRKVSDYPLPTGWFGSNVKEYATYVAIDNPPSSMRPGMTAEVAIRAEQLESVMQLPNQTVFERGGKHWCIVPGANGLHAQEVTIGPTNDKFVVIKGGLNGEQEVLSDPRKHLKDVDLPAATAGDDKQMLAGMPPKSADDEAAHNKRLAAAGGGGGAEAEGRGRRGRGGDPVARLAELLQSNDQNHDGKLEESELQELPAPMRENLMKADTNGDSFLDAAELGSATRAFAAARAAGGGQDGGGAAP